MEHRPLGTALASAATALLLISGCAPRVKAHVTPFQHLAPSPANAPVRIFSTEKPACAYIEVGLVSAEGSRHHPEAILEALKRETRKVGGDAIVNLSESTATKGAMATGDIAVAIRRQVLTGTAVKFTSPDCVP